MTDFSLDGLLFVFILLGLLLGGLYLLIKIAVKSAIRELEEEKSRKG